MDSEDTGGQYVIRYEKDGEMERVLERQAELIGQYEAEEEAQRQWEKQFNENRSSAKVSNQTQLHRNTAQSCDTKFFHFQRKCFT